ncbi:hypothetical protein AMAG_13047 [Allomyces macrogynus ATCC 38327]|uniref:Uncharacterized protein n=1 Tax=Allomyces macrogynus (strain ATCC 38327) TaxID=578462 RepID=A0A0L0T0V1_ALLM3|nr:hypothetical protein AMAG_13047 [Allomyces macrogynus ATCC 38327]|eukprot:KNE68391.1 hypothetical protein AMAG_13047 [Allomyces macrogynus ATCC 38327]
MAHPAAPSSTTTTTATTRPLTELANHPAAPKLVFRAAPAYVHGNHAAEAPPCHKPSSRRSAPTRSGLPVGARAASVSAADLRTAPPPAPGAPPWPPVPPLHRAGSVDWTGRPPAGPVDPRLDLASPAFDPAFALAAPPTGGAPPLTHAFPLYDNVAQYAGLLWEPTGLAVGDLCDQIANADPVTAVRAWRAWKSRADDVHTTWHAERRRRAEARAAADRERRAVEERDRLKFERLRAREGALSLAKAVQDVANNVWAKGNVAMPPGTPPQAKGVRSPASPTAWPNAPSPMQVSPMPVGNFWSPTGPVQPDFMTSPPVASPPVRRRTLDLRRRAQRPGTGPARPPVNDAIRMHLFIPDTIKAALFSEILAAMVHAGLVAAVTDLFRNPEVDPARDKGQILQAAMGKVQSTGACWLQST